MYQVAANDTREDYVLCRGFDTRINKFIDYEAGNPNKPGIPVAKPYDCRRKGSFQIGQIFAALLPLQSANPSPTAVEWRVGQNPGTAETSTGHPSDLNEKVDELRDENGKTINWMFINSSSVKIYTCTLTADLLPGSSAGATLLIGALKNETGSVITVYDVPTAITAAKKIASGTKCRIFKDHDMDLADDEYVLLIPFACEVDQ
jgi:hypothetical protein